MDKILTRQKHTRPVLSKLFLLPQHFHADVPTYTRPVCPMQSDGHVAHLNAENKQHREGGGGGFSQIHCKSPKITVSPAWTKQSFYYVSHRFTQVSMYKTNILQHSSGDGWMDS